MANTSTAAATAPINVYFASVLADESLDLLHSDDIWFASSALKAFNQNNNVDQETLTELLNVFSLINQYAPPNAELARFVTALKNPDQTDPEFRADFSRIVDAYLTEGSKLEY